MSFYNALKYIAVSRSGSQASNKVFFVHVPKCAGGSLISAIDNSYSLLDRVISPKKSVELEASLITSELNYIDEDLSRKVVAGYLLGSAQARFVHGHVHCPPKVIQQFYREWKFITVLRDPVDRFISEYVYNRYKKQDWKNIRSDIYDYVDSPRAVLSGLTYIRYFSDYDDIITEIGPNDLDASLNIALKNLERFDVVAQLESFSDSASQFKDLCGGRIKLPLENVSPKTEQLALIKSDKNLMAKINNICKYDIKLYNEFFLKK